MDKALRDLAKVLAGLQKAPVAQKPIYEAKVDQAIARIVPYKEGYSIQVEAAIPGAFPLKQMKVDTFREVFPAFQHLYEKLVEMQAFHEK
jgi:hypothetical protein